jgi:hypothetical protein
MTLLHRTAALAALLLVPLSAQANFELGKMWTFENPPLAHLQKEYGFEARREWLDALRLAALRYGDGCSASFVSPRGLIMTNHHCAREAIEGATPRGQDWMKTGFFAKEQKDEVELEGLTVQQLVAMEDVTAQINEGVAPGDDEATVTAKRQANEAKVLAAARDKHRELTPQVVKLWQGAVYQLYLYRIWDDVRLVCAAHLQAAYFGGDPDNFTYPRYCTDFTFCRAYENDEPADTSKHYFRWSKGGPKDGELVFTVGNPGQTDRLLTLAQFEYYRDAQMPLQLEQLDAQVEMLTRMIQQVPQLEQQLRTQLFSLSNAQKAWHGELRGLRDPQLLAQKASAEAAFRERIRRNPEHAKAYGDLWDKIAVMAREQTQLEPKLRFHAPGPSAHVAAALLIVRATSPDVPEAERQQARTQLEDGSIASSARAERALLEFLRGMRRWLPKDDPYRAAVLGELEPEAAVQRLKTSKVTGKRNIKRWLDAGWEEIAKSDDPALGAARVLLPLVTQNQKLQEKLAAQVEAYGVQMGRALFAAYGTDVSPDATFTLRFADGVVKGYPYNGTVAPWRTCFHGMFARNAEFDGKHPFDLPEAWLDARDRLELTKGLNFVSTNDIVGGNSGSPVVNKELEIVGLIFDGNIESLPNRFLYRDAVQRAVSVHTDGIQEALLKVHGARRIVDELTGN